MAKFVDPDFPPAFESLGNIGLIKDGHITKDSVTWKRVTEICTSSSGKAELFVDGIREDDITQGALGNCWLLAAFASMARVAPHIIEERFVKPLDPNTGKPTISQEGRYIVQLWDVTTRKWVSISIDDMIPVYLIPRNGKYVPVSAKNCGSEAWVLLLEKAFAKYMGSYAAIEGGFETAALRCLAGNVDYVSCFAPQPGKPWIHDDRFIGPAKREGLSARPAWGQRPQYKAFSVNRDTPAINSIKLFHKLRSWMTDPEHTYIVGAGTYPGSDKDKQDGIYFGHAYAVVGVAFPPGFTMIKLANPHGEGSWKGLWSNGCSMWEEYPEVAKMCGYKPGQPDNGMFWMQLEHFEKMFKSLGTIRLPKVDSKFCYDICTPDDYESEEEEEDDWEHDEEYDEDEVDTDEELEEIFEQFDDDRNGYLNTYELGAALQAILGNRPKNVDVEELLNAVGANRKGATLDQFKELHYLVPYYQAFVEKAGRGGSLSFTQVGKILAEFSDGDTNTAKLAKRLCNEFDEDENGAIDLDEFMGIAVKIVDEELL